MPRHVADDMLMDVLDGAATPETRAHLNECAQCRARVDEARGMLDLAGQAEVPEPSPLYWETFRRQVEGRIAAGEPARWRFKMWTVLATAAASLVLGVTLVQRGLPPAPAPESAELLPAWSPLPSDEEDGGLRLLSALGPSPEDLRGASGCDAVADCVAVLSDEETRALGDALLVELAGRRTL
jgi:hypothetical protein